MAHEQQAGAVIVEIAVALPALVLITALLVWVASLGATYVRALDAAQTAARQVSRGVAPADVPGVVPDGMTVSIDTHDGLVRAVVTSHSSPPLPLFSSLQVTVRAEAVAMPELIGELP